MVRITAKEKLLDAALELMADKDVQEFYMGVRSEASAKGYQRWKRKKRWR